MTTDDQTFIIYQENLALENDSLDLFQDANHSRRVLRGATGRGLLPNSLRDYVKGLDVLRRGLQDRKAAKLDQIELSRMLRTYHPHTTHLATFTLCTNFDTPWPIPHLLKSS